MYAEFLQLALEKVQATGRRLSTGEALIDVRQCRGWLGADSENQGTPAALAQELNYDVAIISLARLLGLEVDVGAFDQPMFGTLTSRKGPPGGRNRRAPDGVTSSVRPERPATLE